MTLLESLFKYNQLIEEDIDGSGDLSSDDEASKFILSDPNAFLIRLIADQSVRSEVAWVFPFKLKERLGHFDLKKMEKELTVEKLEEIIRIKPTLHRFPKNIAKYLYGTIAVVNKKYSGSAENIWNNGVTAQTVVDRLLELPGIGIKKAAVGTRAIVANYGVKFPDEDNINIGVDVHIRRVFGRMGLVKKDSIEDIIEISRKIYPKFPGKLSPIFWRIGRDICRPSKPNCKNCPVCEFCEKNYDK